MVEVETLSMVALQKRLDNGRRDTGNKSRGIVESIKPLQEMDSTKQEQADGSKAMPLAAENSSLLAKLKQQEGHAKEMGREVQKLREEIASLRSLNQVLEREVKGKGDEASALQKELARTQLDAAIKMRAMEQHAANLQSELELVRSQRVQVEERVSTMTRNLTKGKSTVKRLTGELMSKISAQERMINKQRDRLDKAALSCGVARDERGKDLLAKEERRIRHLLAVVEEQRASMEALDRKNNEVSARCRQLEAQKSDANRLVMKLQAQAKKSEIHQILMSHKLKISEPAHAEMEEIHRSKVHDLESRCIRLEARCEALHEDVKVKEGELRQMDRVVEAAFASLGEEIRKLELAFEEQLQRLHSRVSVCSRGHQILRGGLEATISTRNGLELENRELVAGMVRLSEGVNDLGLRLEERIKHLDSRISKCFEGTRTLRNGVEAAASKNDKLQLENRELVKGVMSLDEGFKKLESSFLEQIENLHSKVSRCSEGSQVLRQGLEAVASERSDLEVRNHEMMVRVIGLNQGVDMLEMGFREQIEQLESRFAACAEANQILQHGLQVLTSKKKVLELENHELKARMVYLSEDLRKLGEVFDEQIEYLNAEVTRCYEENRIIKEGLQEVTSRKHELEHENRQLVQGLMVVDEFLGRVELVFKERMEFTSYRILKFSQGYLLMKEWVEAIASKKKELELENRDLAAKVVGNEKDIAVLKEEIASVGAKLEAKEQERKRLDEIAWEHEKRMHEPEEKATKERQECQGRIMELEMAIKAMEEDAKHKDEEKRQAIMQLCMQIEYHRDKYNNLLRTISTPLW